MNTIHLNSDKVESRAKAYLAQMTLEEKVSQLVHNSKAIEKLGIPAYNWWNECLHGVARAGLATVFPQAISMAASWNVELMNKIAETISDEARAKHHDFVRNGKRGIYQGLTYWSPNINIFRDPRWGRGMETYGEDPHLTSRLGVAFVKGIQGDDPDYLKLIATPKHFAVHSGPEYCRHYFNAMPTDRDLWETYLPAFEACIVEAGAYSIMGAYNRLQGEACCSSTLLLEEILRKKWKFEGFVVSDCGAITDIFEHHKIAKSTAEAAALAIRVGTDLSCGQEYCDLVEAVMNGMITEDEINIAVILLMKAKIKLGMFDDPEKVPYSSIPYSVVDCEAHRLIALQSARESVVLLKNENNILPLSKQVKTIAVIGPNGDSPDINLGNYHGMPSHSVSLIEGIRKKVGENVRVIYERGCELAEGLPFLEVLPADHLFTYPCLTKSGLRIEYFNNKAFKGDMVYTEEAEQLNHKLFADLHEKVADVSDFGIRVKCYIQPGVSGTYAIGTGGLTDFRLLVNDKLVTEFHTIWEPEKVYGAIYLKAKKSYKITLEITASTSEAHVQKLLWAIPDETMLQRALKAAAEADVVIMAMGLSPQLEGEEMPVKVEGFKQGDRLSLDLPNVQTNLMRKIAALGKPMVLVLSNGCALSINWEKENIPAIIEAWYGGQAAGDAVADVLFGDYNPSGRLPITFYKSVDDLPAFEDYSMQGRTYRYFSGKPLFEFGFGLSYTTFTYSNLVVPQKTAMDTIVTVSALVMNSGNIAGDEVVQLYVNRINADEKYPIRSLKAFQKINLQAGESKRVEFELKPGDFSVLGTDLLSKVEPGSFGISVGGCQPHNKMLLLSLAVAGIVELY
jgi:beta-glucosidase